MVVGRRISVEGHLFRNEREVAIYLGLKKMVKDGQATNLQVLPEFKLVVNDVLIGTYSPSFIFKDSKGKKHIFHVRKHSIKDDIKRNFLCFI